MFQDTCEYVDIIYVLYVHPRKIPYQQPLKKDGCKKSIFLLGRSPFIREGAVKLQGWLAQ